MPITIFCKKIEKGTFLGNYTGKILNPNDSINDPNNTVLIVLMPL